MLWKYIQLTKILSKSTKKKKKTESNKKQRIKGLERNYEKKATRVTNKADLELAYKNRCWLKITLLCVTSGLYITSVLFDPKADITLLSTYRLSDIYRHAISPLNIINGQTMYLKYSISHHLLYWKIMKRREILSIRTGKIIKLTRIAFKYAVFDIFDI